jgi:hypothetical protein
MNLRFNPAPEDSSLDQWRRNAAPKPDLPGVLRRVPHVDHQAHMECPEGGFQLLDPGGMVEIQQPLDLLLVNPHPPCQFGFSDTAGSKGHVQLRFGVDDS